MNRAPVTDLLVHICCAPCGSASLERLLDEGFRVSILWSNPNIYPRDEHDKRLDYVRKLGAHYNLPLHETPWVHDQWLQAVSGLEDEPEGKARCRACFFFNLTRTAEAASELGIPQFTTTLSISPYKSFSQICDAASRYEAFLPMDFKKRNGYQRSIELSRELGLYRQHYCGCEFSLR